MREDADAYMRIAMPKTVTLHLSEESYNLLREAACAERRSLTNLIETAALAKVREDMFADTAETVEIRDDESLARRLQAGSRDARRRRGRYVCEMGATE